MFVCQFSGKSLFASATFFAAVSAFTASSAATTALCRRAFSCNLQTSYSAAVSGFIVCPLDFNIALYSSSFVGLKPYFSPALIASASSVPLFRIRAVFTIAVSCASIFSFKEAKNGSVAPVSQSISFPNASNNVRSSCVISPASNIAAFSSALKFVKPLASFDAPFNMFIAAVLFLLAAFITARNRFNANPNLAPT